MEKLTTAFVFYIGICGFVWAGFVRLEGLLKADTRTQIASWVSGSQQQDNDSRWPATFGVVFDRVFTEKHWSWRCFRRSCVASLLAVVVMTAVLSMVNRELGNGFWEEPLALITVPIFAGIFNLFPDYLSLLETRFVLRRMAKGNAGTFKLFGWLIFDAVVTLGIFAAPLLAIFLLIPGLEVKGAVEFMTGGLLYLFGVESRDGFFGIFIYSTFFTSVWVWLYVFAGIAVRLIYRAKRIQTFVDKHLDVATRPLSVMGVVLIVVFTITYWPAIAMVGGS